MALIANLDYFHLWSRSLSSDPEIRLGHPQNRVSNYPIRDRHRDQGPDVQGKARVVVEQVEDLLSRLDGTTAIGKLLCVHAGELEVCERLD